MKEVFFDLAVSKQEGDFIRTGLSLEGEVASDILTALEVFPYLGSLIKLGKIGVNYMDLHFVRKMAKFLKMSEDIPEDNKEAFLQKLSDRQRQKLYEYLVHFLYEAESDEKAEVMGLLYRERILNRIDDSLFLRLCAVVVKCFIDDITYLNRYVEPNETMDYITDNLSSYGLLTRYMHHRVENSALKMSTQYKLNNIGLSLYNILKTSQWC